MSELNPHDLEGLLTSCKRNGREAIIPAKQPKIYFDADRFRWWFRYGQHEIHPLGLTTMCKHGGGLQHLRAYIDNEMNKHPDQVHP